MKASPRFFLGVLDRKSPPAVCRGGGRSAAPCCSSSSSSRTGCAKAASASPPNHLARVRCSHGARARKVLTSCAHSGVRRKFFERLRWGPRTRTHHLLLRRHGLCEALRCACPRHAARPRSVRVRPVGALARHSLLTFAALSLLRSGPWFDLGRARGSQRQAQIAEKLSASFFRWAPCARALSSRCAPARSGVCAIRVHRSVEKSVLFAGAVCGFAQCPWYVGGAF